MRLFILRLYSADGGLRILSRAGSGEEKKCGRKRRYGGVLKEELQPHQGSVFEDVTGVMDRINIISLGTISTHVFCTPRCYMTKSWEVGVCNTYQLRYLCGGASPTSFDIHVIMVMEVIQVFLQQIEIRDQSVGYFYLPDDLSFHLALPSNNCQQNMPASCKGLWKLILSMSKRMKGIDDGMSVTAMLAHLNLTRRSYFNDLHLDTNFSKGSAHKVFLKLLGYLHGKIIYQLQQKRLKLRQYYGHCPMNLVVSIDMALYYSNNLLGQCYLWRGSTNKTLYFIIK